MKRVATTRYLRYAILMGSVLMASCTVGSIIADRLADRLTDRDWLYDLAHRPTQSKWNKHIDEVVYLVSMGDKQALNATRVMLPTVLQDQANYPKSDVLAERMYIIAKLNGVDKLPLEQQIAWIQYYDQHQPEAWKQVRNDYKRQHRESFSMIPEPPDPIAATAPATLPTSPIAAATQAASAPAVAATRPMPETPIAAATQPVTPIAAAALPAVAAPAVIAKPAAGSLQKVPQNKSAATPAEEKPGMPESTF